MNNSGRNTVMLIGPGGLGSVLLELLAREDDLGPIVVASRSVERGEARCNLARLGAMAQGYLPSISFVQLDLNQPEAVAETVDRVKPDLILSAATLQPWWLPDLLPEQSAARIWSAGFGVWLPVHMTLTLKLMQALRDARYPGVTLTAPFPDVINCVLGRLGLAPTCGIGNLDEIVPKVRLLAAQRMGVAIDEVRVQLVAHHALEPAAFGESDEVPPFFLRVEIGGEDVTDEADGRALLLAPYPVTPGEATHFLTAGSTVRLVRALLSEEEHALHAPAPNGLPGGYPVLAGGGQVRVQPIAGLTLEQAIDINERSHPFDGIERIEENGTVVFVPAAAEVLWEELGYDCPRLAPQEAEGRAQELMARFRDYARRLGVELP